MIVQQLARRTGVVAIGAIITVALLGTAGAQQRRRGSADEGTVSASSRYGNPSATARVRRGAVGPEVNIGNNTWLPCAADCADTLRREKVDFWETKRQDGSRGG